MNYLSTHSKTTPSKSQKLRHLLASTAFLIQALGFSATAVIALGIAQPSQAQTATNENINYYFDISLYQQTFQQSLEHIKKIFPSAIIKALSIPKDKEKLAQRTLELCFADFEKTAFNWSIYKQLLLEQYTTVLSNNDIKQLISFAKTPLGKKYYAQQAFIMKEYSTLSMKQAIQEQATTVISQKKIKTAHEQAAFEFLKQGLNKRYLNQENFRDLLDGINKNIELNDEQQIQLASLLVPAYARAFKQKELEKLLSEFNDVNNLPIFQRQTKAEEEATKIFIQKVDAETPKTFEKFEKQFISKSQ